MISALSWIPRGAAKSLPKEADFNKEELDEAKLAAEVEPQWWLCKVLLIQTAAASTVYNCISMPFGTPLNDPAK